MNSVNSTAVAIKFKLVLVSVLLLSSCSFFNSKNNENDLSTSGAQPESFKQVVSPLGNPTTTAIEVATEFYDVNNQQRPDFMPTVEPSSPSSLTSVDEVDDEEEDVEEIKPATLKKRPRTRLKSNLSKKGRHLASSKKRKKGQYVVAPGDTLMKISFESYGDILRWREILESNKDQIKDVHQLRVGQVLRIEGEDYIVVERNGEPYLIRKNDTLLKISNKVYGTQKLWKAIWHNNPQLIKNPNKIYAGLTLYYLDSDQYKLKSEKLELRQPASRKKQVRAQLAVPEKSVQVAKPTEPVKAMEPTVQTAPSASPTILTPESSNSVKTQ